MSVLKQTYIYIHQEKFQLFLMKMDHTFISLQKITELKSTHPNYQLVVTFSNLRKITRNNHEYVRLKITQGTIWQFLSFNVLMYLTMILLISHLFRPIYRNRMLYLMIHADYENSVHCRKNKTRVNYLFCKVVTFISRINLKRKQFLVQIYVFCLI